MIRLKLELAGLTFSVEDLDGFRKALNFFSAEKGLKGKDWLQLGTPPELRVLSWLPTGVRIEFGATDELTVRRAWKQLEAHIKANEELASIYTDVGGEGHWPPQEPMQFSF